MVVLNIISTQYQYSVVRIYHILFCIRYATNICSNIINRQYMPSFRYLTLQFFVINHSSATRFIRLALLIREVKLHKPIVVELLCYRL